MMKKLLLTLALGGVIGASLQGAVILYDDFSDYSAGNVDGVAGSATTGSYGGAVGSGSPSDWDGDDAGGFATFETGTGLSYPGMTTTDGVLQINRPSGSFNQGFYNANNSVNGAAGNSVLYFSALINISSGTEGARFGLDLSDDVTGARRSEIGFTAAGNAGIWNNALFDEADPIPAPNVSSTGTYAFDTTYLLVGKIEDHSNWSGSNDRVTMWLNPSDNVEANNAALLDVEVGFNGLFPSDSNITEFALQAGTQDAGDTVQFDQLRIGTEFSDVVAIPEPSTIALLGLAGLATIMGLRRRKG